MNRALIIVFTGLSLAAPFSCRQAPKEKDGEDQKMNVVFFLVDDMGWRDAGSYGSTFYETPNIDRFAKDGVRFTNAYAACHVCSPTRASIITGKYPARLHLTDWLPGRKEFPFQRFLNAEIHQHLPFEEITIAETLKEHGYSTAIIGKWHLGEDPSGPLQHGFDVQIPDWNKGWPLTYYSPFRLKGLEGPDGEYLTDRLTDEAVSYIEENRANPFFLYLSHFAVHDPIQGRPDLVEKYTEKLNRIQPQEGPPFILEGNPDAERKFSREELNSFLQQEDYQGYSQLPNHTVKIKQHQDNVQFAAMIESMDESLGRVLSKLEELGLDEKTIVIFFSDNGGMAAANFGRPHREVTESMLDKAFSTSNLPLRGAKGWLYEGGIRVPMIVRWPNEGKHGSVCEVPVISTDFYPTILKMLGIGVPQDQILDGVSIVPLLKGETSIDREAIYWHFPHYSNHGMQSPGGAVRYGDYKLLEYYENKIVQLFNLKDDPGEQNDLSRSNTKKVLELGEMLQNWRKDVNARMMEPNPDYSPVQE